MNITEVIETHGAILAADAATDVLVAWDDDDNIFSVVTGNKNGDYELTEQYDGENDGTIHDAMNEADDVLETVTVDNNDDED